MNFDKLSIFFSIMIICIVLLSSFMTVELAHEIHANREIPSYLKQGSIDLKPLGAKVDNETLYIHQVYNSKK